MSHFAVSNPKSLFHYTITVELIPILNLRLVDASLYKQTLHKLVTGSYLIASTILSHVSPRDKFLQYEADEKRKLKNFPTARELREAKERAASRLKREQDEAAKVGLIVSMLLISICTFLTRSKKKRPIKDTHSRTNKVRCGKSIIT